MTDQYFLTNYGSEAPIARSVDVKATFASNFVFGAQDAIISTVGLAIGLAAGGASKKAILTSLLLSTLVGGVSMGVSTFMAADVADEIKHADKQVRKESIESAIILLLAELIGAATIIAPFALSSDPQRAAKIAAPLAVVVLGMVGFLSAWYGKANVWLGFAKSATVGGIAIAVGYVAGKHLA